MSRVFVVGDTHGKLDIQSTYAARFPQQRDLTKEDVLIIAGDAGIIWNGLNSKGHLSERDRRLIRAYERRSFTTAYIDGNHENHHAISLFPVEEWNGGKVHRISPSIVHLMRGECYNINGKKIFTMGGATSIDKIWRKPGISWWAEEMPSKKEYEHAKETIKANSGTFDYIITHCTATDIQRRINPKFDVDQLTDFFNTLIDLKYKKWLFGHYHIDKEIDDKYIALYRKVVELQ